MPVPSFSLEGKKVVVSGGSRGLGRTVALLFAEAGADVSICARNLPDLEKVAEEIRGLGRQALAIPTNIAVKEEVDNLFSRTLEEFGTIDVLVNNAAWNIARSLLELREDGWERVMNVDLKGYFLCSQAVAGVMMEKKSGSIINVVSAGAKKAAPMLGAYSVAKAGVVMLTKIFALELAKYDVTVNAVGPNMMRTGFSEPLWSAPGALERIVAGIPMGRLAEAEDIAGTILFLASDASRYLTGQTIYVDGGVLA